MPTFTYPTTRELQAIGPAKVARLTQDRVGFQIMPKRPVNAGAIQWTQQDNYFGLQQLRGLDGAPTHVKRVGAKSFVYEPGIYGEFQHITETELTMRAGSVMSDAPVDVGDLVLASQDQLMGRELDRQELVIWTMLTTGVISVLLPSGEIGFTATFPLATYDASDWATETTATPLADFRAMRIANVGKGANFGAGARGYANSTTLANMLNNTNAADLGGKRLANDQTVQSVSQANAILAASDAPTLVEYDEGYYNDSNVFTRYIPDNYVVVIGQRPGGAKIGEYIMTRNAQNPGFAPGSYEFVVDKTGNAPDGQRQVPANITIHRGHNGGIVIYFPGSIVIMNVGP
jgi:hypothetical protein